MFLWSRMWFICRGWWFLIFMLFCLYIFYYEKDVGLCCIKICICMIIFVFRFVWMEGNCMSFDGVGKICVLLFMMCSILFILLGGLCMIRWSLFEIFSDWFLREGILCLVSFLRLRLVRVFGCCWWFGMIKFFMILYLWRW